MTMMRLLRLAITVIFAATVVVFCRYWYLSRIKADRTYPVISIENDTIEVSLKATDEELLAGVTAYDEKDGDLTDRIIVESISKFTEIGTCKVHYAVCDNDNHVSSAYRKVVYKGYTSPVFTMNRPLCFSQLDTVDAAAVIGAYDVIDGDISNNIIITSTDYEYGVNGTYSVKAEVTNSKGDQINISLPLIVEDRSVNAPVITLTDYLIYRKKGEKVDPAAYFVSALDSYEQDVSATMRTENNYKADVPGVYSFHYFAEDQLGRQGHSVLTVVVS